MLAVLLPLCGEPLSIGAYAAESQLIRGFVASLSRDDVNFGYVLGVCFMWCPEGDLNPHDLIRVCGF
jgi:hypothetical protein